MAKKFTARLQFSLTIILIMAIIILLVVYYGTKKETFTLLVEIDGHGQVEPGPGEHIFSSGEGVMITAWPEDDFLLLGWQVDGQEFIKDQDVLALEMARDIKVTVYFQEIPPVFSLQYQVEPLDGGDVVIEPWQPAYTQKEQVYLQANPAPGYIFCCWEINQQIMPEEDDFLKIMMLEDKEVVAHFFQEPEIVLTYDLSISMEPADAGRISYLPVKDYYHSGDNITLEVLPQKGYLFLGWEINGVVFDDREIMISMDQDRSVIARFTELPVVFTLSMKIDPPGAGQVTRSPLQDEYVSGDVVNISAIPGEGYEFTEWVLDGEVLAYDTNFSLLMEKDQWVKARFTELPPVFALSMKIDPPGAGQVTRSPLQDEYAFGDVVNISAIPREGYEFTEWVLDGEVLAYDPNFSLLMEKDQKVEARFARQTFTLSFGAEPGDAGIVIYEPMSEIYELGQEIRIKAEAAAGYIFSSWLLDDQIIEDLEEIFSFTVDQDREIVAFFEPISTFSLQMLVEPYDSGFILVLPEEDVYLDGTQVFLSAEAREGFEFFAWEINGQLYEEGWVAIQIDEDQKVLARFVPLPVPTYALTVEVNPSGSGSVLWNPQKESYELGEEVTLLARPEEGMVFERWEIGGVTEEARESLNITIDREKNVVAYFAPLIVEIKTVDLAGGWHHSAVLLSDGTLYAWGRNEYGQVGDGGNRHVHVPSQITALENVTAVVGGGFHTLAVRKDGTVWAWGQNEFGQLGDGTTINRSRPVQVINLWDIVDVSSEGHHSVALRKDGTVWIWGSNSSGQLGDGTQKNSSVPVEVKGLHDVVAVSAGGFHSLALRKDGTIWSWGSNSDGQLGNGTLNNSLVPVQVKGIEDVVAIACGYRHSLALREDGTIWAWGYNFNGQLGTGNNEDSLVPVMVSGLKEVVKVAGGGFHTLALKKDGTVWAWGRNEFGQLGDGGTQNRYEPVMVRGLWEIVDIVAGSSHNLALNSQDILFVWGRNSSGQLGDGRIIHQYLPVPALEFKR